MNPFPFRFMLSVLLGLTMPLFSSCLHADDDGTQPLLHNGGFEAGLDGWKTPKYGIVIEQGGSFEGDQHVRITVPQDHFYVISQELSNLEPGKKYTAGIRVRSNSFEDGRFLIRNTETGNYLTWKTLPDSEDWTLLQISFNAPPTAEIVTVELNFRSQGTCELDEITVTPES